MGHPLAPPNRKRPLAEKYYNPQEDPGSEKRTFIVIGITLLMLVGAQFFFKSPQPPAENKPAQTAPAPAASTPVAPAPSVAPSTAPTPKGKGGTLPQVASKQAASEEETVIENGLYKITFNNRGAQVKSWILKKHTDEKGNPLELVHPLAAQQFGYPLSLYTYDPALTKKLSEALYVASNSGAVAAPASVSFEYADGDVSVSKKFTFDHSYVVQVETSVTRGGQPVTAYPAWPSGFGDETVLPSYANAQVVSLEGDKVHRQPVKERNYFSANTWVVGGGTTPGPFEWAGAVDQYFGAIFLPDDPRNTAMVTFHGEIKIPEDLNKPDPAKQITVPVIGAAVGNPGGPTSTRLFVGPKATDVLESIHANVNGKPVGANLEPVVDLGRFAIIAKPLFLWLKWTHDHWIANWGWSIVILTIIINVALLPLRVTGMKTSLKMQRMQPKIEEVKKRYEKYPMRDPRRAQMNQEIWDLQRKEGANPISGCLPLLLQLPFLYAFYAMLANTIELRHAPWLWIHDLSSPDPNHILPIITVATMFLMTRLTPQVGMDPTQRMMMNTMSPIMFGIFTWAAAAGLALYWTIGNVIGAGQQWGMNRTSLGRELREMQEKRARKKNK
jgi:YidC/Oxa1 family membrane protein insertase